MRTVLVVPLLLMLTGCASAVTEKATPSHSRNLLSLEELEGSGLQTAFTAIQSLRPQWLRKRGPASVNVPMDIRVYLDSNRMGGPDFLRNISVNDIASISYMNGMEATQRYGLDHGMGAIIVVSKR